jgi:hypothetical protein
MSDQDATIDLDGYGAIPSSYGTDTITLDPSHYITLPSSSNTFTYGAGATVGGITTITGLNNTWNTGTNGYSLNTGTTGYSFNPTPTTVQINTSGIEMAAGTDIKVGGHSLKEFMSNVEERLGILHPNPALEERWDKLKDLRRQYIEMEKDILEKEKIMKILKES